MSGALAGGNSAGEDAASSPGKGTRVGDSGAEQFAIPDSARGFERGSSPAGFTRKNRRGFANTINLFPGCPNRLRSMGLLASEE